jgi:CPA1 family monovalent cation:H+ antiporter
MNSVQLFDLMLGWTATALVLSVLAERLRLPPAAVFTLGGVVLALVPGVPPLRVDPGLIMALFVPPLLLSSAYFMPWRDFQAELRPILLLAVGAVLFTTVAVAWAAKAVAPDLPWAACCALGAAVSPPDAVAAKAVLQRLRLPRRLMTVLEGESLVNDASGLVVYRFAVTAALTGSFHPLRALGDFAYLAAGGIVMGLGVALACGWLFRHLRTPPLATVLSFLAAWVSYILGDAVHASGVLAVVACGLRMGWHQHDIYSAEIRAEGRAVWTVVSYLLEALVFILIGLALRGVLHRMGGDLAGLRTGLPLAAATVGAVVLSRFAWVYPGTYLPRWFVPSIRRRDPMPSPAVPLLVGWAGMRGVVTLAAALALPQEFPHRDEVQFATFAVILVTVLLQGTTIGKLARVLDLSMPERSDSPVLLSYHAARTEIAEAALRELRATPADTAGDKRGDTSGDKAGNGDGDAHPRLIEEFERRLRFDARMSQGETDTAARGMHFEAWLQALEASRRHLVSLHRQERLHDDVLHAIEAELDLEELRIKAMLEQVRD